MCWGLAVGKKSSKYGIFTMAAPGAAFCPAVLSSPLATADWLNISTSKQSTKPWDLNTKRPSSSVSINTSSQLVDCDTQLLLLLIACFDNKLQADNSCQFAM